MSRHLSFAGIMACLLFVATQVHAQNMKIEIPEDELPSERVMPKLDSPAAVRARKLTFTKRIEARLHAGWMLDDPFYDNQYFGASVVYHLNEDHGFGLKYQKWNGGLSKYSEQLQTVSSNVQMGRAPGPDSSLSGLYEYNAFYGKVNFSQNTVVQFVMAGELEAGMMKYGSKAFPLIGAAAAQKVFFTKHWGAQIDFRILFHEAIDPNSVDLRGGQPVPKEGDFDSTFQFSNQLNLSVLYLF